MNFPDVFSQKLVLAERSDILIESGKRSEILISADNDVDAIAEWINRYRHSPHTFSAARKDAERFYLWIRQKNRSLREVKKADCEEYRDFLGNPTPAGLWCGSAKPRRNKNGLANAEWKPFVGPLKDSSVRQSCRQLFGLYEFLSNAGYINGNPWRLLVRRAAPKSQIEIVERFLDKEAMMILRAYIESLQYGNNYERKHYPRVRWIFSLLYLSAARRAEFTSAKMGDVRRVNGKWWWKVLGKGSIYGDIPVNEEFLFELSLYRASIGLNALPSANEPTPLLCDIFGKNKNITPSTLYKVVKQVLKGAADQCKNEDCANKLRQASTHWMRHTAATDQANSGNTDLINVSKNLRHASISTTSIYVHADREKRHAQTESHVMWEKTASENVEN